MKKKTKKSSKKILRKKKAPSKKKTASKKSKTTVTRKGGKSKAKKAPKKQTPKAPKIEGLLLGRIQHYFPHVNAAALKIKKGSLQVGDRLRFKGHTTDFTQTVESLQIDHVVVQKVGVGDDVGIQVKERVREHDAVYKIS